MLENYQPLKFRQFDGKGNPRQHVAHFMETCNNAGTYRDLVVKQFVQSLKGSAFDWYIDLEPKMMIVVNNLSENFSISFTALVAMSA